MGCIAESILSVRRMKQPFQNTDKPSALLRFVVRVFRGASCGSGSSKHRDESEKSGENPKRKTSRPSVALAREKLEEEMELD